MDTPPENHYVIKLVNEDSKKKEIVFFVRADSNFEGLTRKISRHRGLWVNVVR